MVPLLTFWQEWTAAVLLLFVVFGFLVGREDALSIQVPQIALAPLGLSFVIVLQLLLHQYDFIDQLMVPLAYLLLAGLACVLGKSFAELGVLERASSWIAICCLLGGVFSVGVQLAQVLDIDNGYYFMSKHVVGRPYFANLNQANHLAAYLAIALGSAFYLQFQEHIRSSLFLIVSTLLVLGLVLTAQRSALIYVFMPLVLNLWANNFARNRSQLNFKASLALPILFGVFHWVLRPLFEGSTAHLYAALDGNLYQNRWMLWRHALTMFETHIWLGVGFSQFWGTYVQQVTDIGFGEVAAHPHNIVAALLSESGLIGTLAVILPLLFLGLKSRLRITSSAEWFAWSQIAIIAFYSLVEYPLWYTYWLVIAGFWLGAVDPVSRRLQLIKPRLLAVAFFLIVSIVMINTTFSYLKLRDIVLIPTPAEPSDADEFSEYRANAFTDLSHSWFFQTQASTRMAIYWVMLDADHLYDKLVFNERALRARPNFNTLHHQIVLSVLNGDIASALYWARVLKGFFPSQYERFATEWPNYANRWPKQFNPNIVGQLTKL